MYFDFHHAEGAFPNEGRVQQGKKVDLFRFMLEGIKEHGIQGTRIGDRRRALPVGARKGQAGPPGGSNGSTVSDVLTEMRQVKTDEELALWARAYVYFDRAHAFARDYILTHGTDVTDYEVAVATELWANDLLYSELDLAGGAVHHGVGQRCVTSGFAPGRSPRSRIPTSLTTTGSAATPHCRSRADRAHRRLRSRELPPVHSRRRQRQVRRAHAQAVGGQQDLLRHAAEISR